MPRNTQSRRSWRDHGPEHLPRGPSRSVGGAARPRSTRAGVRGGPQARRTAEDFFSAFVLRSPPQDRLPPPAAAGTACPRRGRRYPPRVPARRADLPIGAGSTRAGPMTTKAGPSRGGQDPDDQLVAADRRGRPASGRGAGAAPPGAVGGPALVPKALPRGSLPAPRAARFRGRLAWPRLPARLGSGGLLPRFRDRLRERSGNLRAFPGGGRRAVRRGGGGPDVDARERASVCDGPATWLPTWPAAWPYPGPRLAFPGPPPGLGGSGWGRR